MTTPLAKYPMISLSRLSKYFSTFKKHWTRLVQALQMSSVWGIFCQMQNSFRYAGQWHENGLVKLSPRQQWFKQDWWRKQWKSRSSLLLGALAHIRTRVLAWVNSQFPLLMERVAIAPYKFQCKKKICSQKWRSFCFSYNSLYPPLNAAHNIPNAAQCIYHTMSFHNTNNTITDAMQYLYKASFPIYNSSSAGEYSSICFRIVWYKNSMQPLCTLVHKKRGPTPRNHPPKPSVL